MAPNCCGFGTSFESRRWLSFDPCGVFGVSISWGVHLYAMSILPLYVLGGSLISWLLYFLLYIPSALLALSSLFMASTTDPGSVPLGARPLVTVRRANSESLGGRRADALSASQDPSSRTGRSSIRRCHKCNDNFKPPRAHHDSVTDRCIVKFDHFCPWVNNSIGALNHKFFCLFLLYTAVTCLLSLLLLLLKVINCSYLSPPGQEDLQRNPLSAYDGNEADGTDSGESHQTTDSRGGDPNDRLLMSYSDPRCEAFYRSHFVLGLLIASLLFLVFTVSMGCEQLDAVETGRGKIARMKMSVGANGTEFARATEEFNEMFGGDSPHPTWHWFLPLTVKFPRGMKKVVLGFDWDETMPASGPYEESESSAGDREMDDLERGGESCGIERESRPTSPLVASASTPQLSAVEPRSLAMSDEASSHGSVASLESGGVKNRRPRSLDGPMEIV